MNIYSVYIKDGNEIDDLTIVKEGFSLWALVFNIFWAFYHKMWLVVSIFAAINILVFSIDVLANLAMLQGVKFVIQLFVFGFFASELQEFYAKKHGLKLDDIVAANSLEEAELRYLTRKMADKC